MRRGISIDDLPPAAAAKVRAAAADASPPAVAPHLAEAVVAGAAKRAKREKDAAKHEQRVAQLIEHLAARGVTVAPVREFYFAQPAAAWRFDFAWIGARVALEADGGAFLKGGGRHGRGAGFREDVAKRNAAALMGWTVIHCLTDELGRPGTADIVAAAIRSAPLEAADLPPAILEARQSAARRRKLGRALPAGFRGLGSGKP